VTRVLRPSSATQGVPAPPPFRARGGPRALSSHDGTVGRMAASFGPVLGIHARSTARGWTEGAR
jgi:hypothetical protein